MRPDGACVAGLDAHDPRLDHDPALPLVPASTGEHSTLRVSAADPAAREVRRVMSRATGAFCGLPNTSKISGRLSGLAVADAAELRFEFVVIDAMHDTGSLEKTADM
ncbi:hypothetical protein J2R87_004370 [Bradyrhizobium elkanii]|nr:hypothetical protein [Bradyrhizobium elkanii]MCS4107863.1 hypothetical protein [Bradyrhizobium elkanii]